MSSISRIVVDPNSSDIQYVDVPSRNDVVQQQTSAPGTSNHICRSQQSAWLKIRNIHKAFLICLLSALVIVETIFWTLRHPGKERYLPFGSDPLKFIETLLANIEFLTYLVFCPVGIHAILFRQRKLTMIITVYLGLMFLLNVIESVYNLIHDPFSKTVIALMEGFWFLTLCILFRLHIYYMDLCMKCY